MPAQLYRRGTTHRALLLAALLLVGFVSLPLRTALAADHRATVTTTADTVDGITSSIGALNGSPGADGRISLREAILAANASGAGTVLIDFNIPTSDAGYSASRGIWLITPDTQLPPLGHGNITLDGGTQAGASQRPTVALDGYNIEEPEGSRNGIVITSAGNTIRRLGIINFLDAGILISGAPAANNRVLGSVIGLSLDASVQEPNYYGVELRAGANNNVIGGPAEADRNIISGNDAYGVYIWGSTTQRNTVAGSWIGLGHNGFQPLGNARGIVVTGSSDNAIGVAGAGNVISSNLIGVELTNGANRNTVAANVIGLGVDGTTTSAGSESLGNGDGGVFITAGSAENVIGGATEAQRNVIANNGHGITPYGHGVWIDGAGSQRNEVIGNFIGVDASGIVQRGNLRYGVSITGAADGNYIGKGSSASGNVIAYNGMGGVRINSTANQVAYNMIGVGVDQQTPLGNQLNGIDVDGEANFIGPQNLIAYNQLSGIVVNGDKTTVQHNELHDNDHSGICVAGAETTVASNEVYRNGGRTTDRTKCNIQGGIVVDSASKTTITTNVVYSNRDVGIRISAGSGNSIRTNSISSNAQAGIQLEAGGNQGIAPPQLIVSYDTISGQACPLCDVEIFADPSDEGSRYIDKTKADANGFFSVVYQNASVSEPHVTATNTDSAGNTSPFAAPQSIPREPLETKFSVFVPLVAR